jgi:two-component system CheB/CheR fusion protein
VVGVSASAGGLDAFKRFFTSMPPDSGLAFVLIQHLDPTHESLAAELLARCTPMPVVQVERDTRVVGNYVYVIPPNRYLEIDKGVLRLSTPPEPRGMRMPIDVFLRSLAADLHEKAIGVVLSGTGTDGTLGLKEIKAAGGMAMVQDPRTAEYDGMPRSAIATGGVDYVLPPETMPRALVEYLRHSYVQERPPLAQPISNDFTSIVALLQARVKYDFTAYKKGTLLRRIRRRMSLAHVERVPDYLQRLRKDSTEVTALFKDLLISVTSFFREPKAWQFLQQEVIPRIVAAKDPGAPVRVWVAGCATGEEAYSIAMLLIEEIQASQKRCPIQIFASDVDKDALDFARGATYPESIAASVPVQRLRRFFRQGEHSYRVNKDVREGVVFAEQNVIADPPFSRIDLISCRNLLIYLEPAIQKKIISLLHFALNPGGYLFLGSAETIAQQDDLFETISKRWRIYRRIGPTRHDKVQFPVVAAPEPGRRPELEFTPEGPDLGRLTVLVQQLLLDRYAPASVVINRKYEILHFSGRTEDYLLHPPGLPTQDLIAKAREGLQTALRAAAHRAIREDQAVTASARLKRDKVLRRVNITIEPLKGSKKTEGLLLVSFRDEPEDARPAAVAAQLQVAASADETLVRQLEQELKTTREDLQSTIEELETSNEELKAANEEVMSINEELQSTNEELETSKEELQSLNEELSTVNSQLESKVTELEGTNNDLENLLTSTNVPTIFLDRQLRIRRFTATATRLFKLIPSDIGRPLGDVAQRFEDTELLPHAAKVLDKLTPQQREIRTDEGRCYVRQVLPYRTQDNRIEGVVVTFSAAAADALQGARLYAESIVDTLHEPLLVLDGDLRVRSANRSFYEAFRTSPAETEGRPIYEVAGRQLDIAALRGLLSGTLQTRKPLQDFEIECDLPDLGRRSIILNARLLERKDDAGELVLLVMEDITGLKRSENALRESESRIRALVDTAADGIIIIDETGTILSVNRATEKLFGYSAAELMGKNVKTLMPSPYRQEHDAYLMRYLQSGEAKIIGLGREVVGLRKDETTFPMDLSVSEFQDGGARRFAGIVRDIGERKRAEEQARQHQAELAHVLRVKTMGELAGGLAHEVTQPLSAIANHLEACAEYVRSGRSDSATLLKLLQQGITEALRAGEVVNRLREFVQRGEPRPEQADLREIIKKALSLVDRQIQSREIQLHLELGRRPLPVLADRIQIEQVLVNLLQNAIDAVSKVPPARRVVRVSTRLTPERMIQVSVEDHGIGLTPAVTERLFDQFFTTKPGGLGMGLSISRSIIEAHSGRLGIAARAGGPGTTVQFTLPLSSDSGSSQANAG